VPLYPSMPVYARFWKKVPPKVVPIPNAEITRLQKEKRDSLRKPILDPLKASAVVVIDP